MLKLIFKIVKICFDKKCKMFYWQLSSKLKKFNLSIKETQYTIMLLFVCFPGLTSNECLIVLFSWLVKGCIYGLLVVIVHCEDSEVGNNETF